MNKSKLLTWSWKTAVVQTGWSCRCSSTSSVWVYSGSSELRPRKFMRCGRPNFLRSVSASKCTTRAWREQNGGGCVERERGIEMQKCQHTHREHWKSPPGAEYIRPPHLREYTVLHSCDLIIIKSNVTPQIRLLSTVNRNDSCHCGGWCDVPCEVRTKMVLKTEVWLTNVWWVVFWVGCEDEAGLDLHAKKGRWWRVKKRNLCYSFYNYNPCTKYYWRSSVLTRRHLSPCSCTAPDQCFEGQWIYLWSHEWLDETLGTHKDTQRFVGRTNHD